MHSSSSKRAGKGSSSSSSSSASSSREIPGFHFDKRTGRYYSLANAPPAYLKQLAEERAKEESELAMKRFKASKIIANVSQKKKRTSIFIQNSSSCPLPIPFYTSTTLLGALYRRQAGLLPHGYQNHHGQHFMEPLSDLFSTRLRLNEHHQHQGTQNGVNVLSMSMPEEYSKWKSSFSIKQIRNILPNSFIMGPFSDNDLLSNNCYFLMVTPEKVSKIK